MWEKQTGTAEAKRADRPADTVHSGCRKEPQEDRLLFVQILLCIAITLAVWLCRAMGGTLYSQLCSRCTQWLSQGVQFTTETPIARFGAETVEVLRDGVQAVLAGLEQTKETARSAAQPAADSWQTAAQQPGAVALAAGGFWHWEGQEAPEGASLEQITLQPPLAAPVNGVVTSGYGYRENPVNGIGDFHAGVDIACAEGTPVGACGEGQVAFTGSNDVRGNYLVIRHGGGVQTLYQHLACIVVRPGQRIDAGQEVGMAGSTGLSTGPHVHLELEVGGILYDPLPSLPAEMQAQTA